MKFGQFKWKRTMRGDRDRIYYGLDTIENEIHEKLKKFDLDKAPSPDKVQSIVQAILHLTAAYLCESYKEPITEKNPDPCGTRHKNAAHEILITPDNP